jgi:hypothetical protein
MRAAAETVQAIFLLRELFMEPYGLFIQLSFSFRFDSHLLRVINQAKNTVAMCFHLLGGQAALIQPQSASARQAAFFIFLLKLGANQFLRAARPMARLEPRPTTAPR